MDAFSALADPKRRSIVELLARSGAMPATEIYDRFNVSHPAISQHLQVLRLAKLVRVEKCGQQRIYRLNPKAITEIEEWARRTANVWEVRFDRLDRVLESERKNAK